MSKTVLVTGASSGIGAAAAHLLGSRGFKVFGTTRSPHPVSPGNFEMLSLDVNSDASARSCVEQVLARAGRIDVLVNNAGYALSGAAEETSIAEAKEQFETNFFGVVRMVNVVLPSMREAGTGRIITIGSLAGLMALPFGAFYCATKFGLEGYSESLAYELEPFGISVTLIEPGFVRTGISHAARYPAGTLPAYEATRKRAIAALGKAVSEGIPAEPVARAVLTAVESAKPRLRYRVGADARWLPRLRKAVPFSVFAGGVRRRFGLSTAA
jgi:NAD(P)-dependent dehydrogenase (short-subunit alcohol dehydrogenase family)